MLGAEHLLLPPEERSASWRNSDYTEVYRWVIMMVFMVVVVVVIKIMFPMVILIDIGGYRTCQLEE